MNVKVISFFVVLLIVGACSRDKQSGSNVEDIQKQDSVKEEQDLPKKQDPEKLAVEKDFLYDQHTLEDVYPYKDTTREFQWRKIREGLALVDSVRELKAEWGILQNRSNKNGEAPLVHVYKRNSYKRIADSLGVERWQGIPLYLPADSVVPERYGMDGELVRISNDSTKFIKAETVYVPGKWIVPKKYVHAISDTVVFNKVIFVDRKNQNIATFEKDGAKWLVRSMNPATTGLHKPPYMQETPLGLFVIQEKKPKMIYLVDGSQKTGGFAPYASRFCNGGYIHGVPVNAPRSKLIEFSPTLGTTPHSHMCVRNATSHAKFVFDWAPVDGTIVFVLE